MKFCQFLIVFVIGVLTFSQINAQTCPTTSENKTVQLDFQQLHIVEEIGTIKKEGYIIQVFIKTQEPHILYQNIIAYPISDNDSKIYIGFYNQLFFDKKQAELVLEQIRKIYCDAFIKPIYYGQTN